VNQPDFLNNVLFSTTGNATLNPFEDSLFSVITPIRLNVIAKM